MSQYKLTHENWVIRIADGARIATSDTPEAPNENPDYLEYKSWLDDGGEPLPADVVPEEEAERLTAVLNGHLDAVAGQRRYDNRFTCALRAGFSGPFQQEGQVFAAWMDACNIVAYTVMAECRAGMRPIPSDAELIAAMPAIAWPPSPIPEGAV